MLVPFNVNQNVVDEFKIPAHIIDWHRIRILKEIDDIRFTAMQEGNLDLSLDALKALKFYKLCMLSNPLFDAVTGKTILQEPLGYAYDVSKEEIIAAIDEFSERINPTKVAVYLTLTKNFINNMKLDKTAMARLETTGYGEYGKVQADTAPLKYALFVPSTAYYNMARELFKLPLYVAYAINNGSSQLADPLRPRDRNIGYLSGSSVLFFDFTTSTPKLLQGAAVMADVAAYIAVNNDSSVTSKILEKTIPLVNGIVQAPALADYVTLYEPNIYYPNMSNTYPAMKTPSGGTYSLTVPSTAKTFVQWYRRRTVTLPNGKTYLYPAIAISNIAGQTAGQDNITFIDERHRSFFDMNKSSYQFPPYFPKLMINGDYKVRNGTLYADAANYYEPEFFRYPEPTIEKLSTVVTMQSALDALREDIKTGEVGTDKYSGVSYILVDGKRTPFLHPITLLPVTVEQYTNELVFESARLNDEATKEINAFLTPLKIQNNYSYQKAYEAFLRGEATMKGPEALALFENRLLTGIFYMDGGFQYWRPFTPLELKLIELMKEKSLLNKQQADINLGIIQQNAVYLAEANASVLKYNEDKMAIAKIMAEAELKVMADNELAKMVAPTMEYLILRAETEGGFPSDALARWVNENPYYYLRGDTHNAVNNLLEKLSDIEAKVATALVADVVAEVEFTKALQELFTF